MTTEGFDPVGVVQILPQETQQYFEHTKNFRCISGHPGKIIWCISTFGPWPVPSLFRQISRQRAVTAYMTWTWKPIGPRRFTGEGEPSLWTESRFVNRQWTENGPFWGPQLVHLFRREISYNTTHFHTAQKPQNRITVLYFTSSVNSHI